MKPSPFHISALALRRLSLLVLTTVAGSSPAAEAPDRAGDELFEAKIRPVLVERCYSCHSGGKKVRGGLRLDTQEMLRQGGSSGPALAPGQPEKSLLITAIRQTDPDLRMPPRGKLSPQEVADFETWVKQGAPFPAPRTADRIASERVRHWSFQPPREPPLPEVRRKEWLKNDIDRFILARLEAKDLPPAAPADRRTLLRRVTWDLTGLPPTPDEVDAFLGDTRPDAFARVVERLLASERYGERWARHWLDLVRYCDDFEEAWRYRDWVVKVCSSDLPYDRFILAQIAGDRLPPSEPGEVNADGIVATTFLSLGPWGGIDRRKRMADIVDDQVDTVGRSFLGLTLACARCHDHKFDPVTAGDYYGLAGIFYSSRVISDTVYLSHGTQRLRVPLVAPAEVKKHEAHVARIGEQKARLEREVEKAYSVFARSLLPQTAEYLLAAWDYQHRPAGQAGVSSDDWASKHKLKPFALAQWLAYLDGSRLEDFAQLDQAVRNYDGEEGVHVWGARAERPWWGVNSGGREVPIETWLLPPRSVAINPGVEGGAIAWKSPFQGTVRIRGKLTDGDPHDGSGVAWAIDHVRGTDRRELSSGSLPNGSSKTLAQGRSPERLDTLSVKAGDVVFLQVWLREGDAHYDITTVELNITRLDDGGEWDLTREVVDNLLAGNPHADSKGNAGVWGFYNMAGSNRKQRMPAVDRALEPWQAATGKQDRKALEQAARDFQSAVLKSDGHNALAEDLTGIRSPFWVNQRDDNQYLPATARDALARGAAEVNALEAGTLPLPCAHGAQEGGPRFSLFPGLGDVRIHRRGSTSQLGKRVPRHFPHALASDRQPPIREGSGRLELARWIASPDNPLTARVMVNRIWQHHFGDGIVRTPSNFGTLGTPPSHPELLDYLARRFVASGWSIKAMHRLILLSAAYQQASIVPPASLRLDPNNQLFGRMNRRRLEAEALRDSLLAICGCLDLRGGGPAQGDPSSTRRMLYLRVARSDRTGFGTIFDVADPSIQVDRRTASTVAPQALYLMNNPLISEKVGLLVKRPEIAAAKQGPERIQALYRLVFGRRASAEEAAIGARLVQYLEEQPPGPKEALTPWETYAQALLLSNELLFVD